MYKEPFWFRNNGAVHSLDELVQASTASPSDAIHHLKNGHFEPWLTYIGRPDLAQKAASARQSKLKSQEILEQFLEAASVLQTFAATEMQEALAKLTPYLDALPLDDIPTEDEPYLWKILSARDVLNSLEKKVVFFGVFSSGKSTLVNALIQRELLPHHENRSTGAVTLIKYAQAPAATILKKSPRGPRSMTVPIEEVNEYIELRRSAGKAHLPKDVLEVHIHLPCKLCDGNHIVLVDTLGLEDAQEHSNLTFTAVRQADLAVMVLDAPQVLSEREREIAWQISSSLNHNLVFVLNRLDRVDEDERDEVQDWVSNILIEKGFDAPQIFTTSALVSLQERLAKQQPGELQQGLLQFETWLTESLSSEQGDRIALLSRLGSLKGAVAEAQAYFRTKFDEASQQREKLEAKAVKEHDKAIKAAEKRQRQAEKALHKLKLELPDLGEMFAMDCVEGVESLIKYDDDWQTEEKIASRVTDAFSRYADRISSQVQAAVSPVGYKPKTFRRHMDSSNKFLDSDDDEAIGIGMIIGGIIGSIFSLGLGSFVGAMFGGWIGKTLFGADAEAEVLNAVRDTARDSVPDLIEQANEYIRKVEKGLKRYAKRHRPKLKISARYSRVIQTEKHYQSMQTWCHEMQALIKTLETPLEARE